MARSIQTLYDLIVAEKTATSELDGLTSNSATAIWRLWAWVTASVLYTVEVMHDLFKAEISMLLQILKPGTLPWYQALCKAFQYGHALQWLDGKYVYAAIDDAAKIVKQCSVTEGLRGLVIKVATETAGQLQPLSVPQEAAFTSYISRRKYAGTKVVIINSVANSLKVIGTIIYDPLVIAADGTDIASNLRTIDLAIQNFLRNLPFNGRLRITSLIDAIQAVEGVYDVSLHAWNKYAAYPYAEIEVSHIPESGYFKIDPAFPLSANLTYQANV